MSKVVRLNDDDLVYVRFIMDHYNKHIVLALNEADAVKIALRVFAGKLKQEEEIYSKDILNL